MNKIISLSLKNIDGFVSAEEVMALAQKSAIQLEKLNNKTGLGNDFLGWLSLPEDIESQFDDIEKCAKHLRKVSEATVVIGIGGSYLGAKAVIEALSNSIPTAKRDHEIYFAGHTLSEDYLADLLEVLDKKEFSIVVISKSGTTTEPAIAFRVLKRFLENKVGEKEAANRIVAITDEKKGALRGLANGKGYKTFVIPDNIGGRFSVLTPVGLLPIALCGFDIRALVKGAKDMEAMTRFNKDANSNMALQYAAARNLLLGIGKTTEIFVCFTPKLHYMAEWWKQLYGESEGKEGKGIFPAGVDFTTDLHSMGQYIQEGQRIIFETFLSVTKPSKKVVIPMETDDADQLNYLAGRRVTEVNHNAETGTILAHKDGGVPVIRIEIPELSPYYLGQLIYFYEIACGISGYILDVNPFNQPGVEAYKKNMFALLNKPGYEEANKKIMERLK